MMGKKFKSRLSLTFLEITIPRYVIVSLTWILHIVETENCLIGINSHLASLRWSPDALENCLIVLRAKGIWSEFFRKRVVSSACQYNVLLY